MTPVNVPATNPAAIAAIVAIKGSVPDTISAAATEAPSVTDPSAVISAKLNILKLINIPSDKRASIRPIVIAPNSKDISVFLS
jgi:hypothetical protein